MKAVTARTTGRSVEVDGPGVYAAITALGIARMRPKIKSTTAWLISADRAEELFAYLERAGRRIEVTL